jgi:hypothetical protein
VGDFALSLVGVAGYSHSSSSVRSMGFAGGSRFCVDSLSDSELDSIIFRVARCLGGLFLEHGHG